MVSSLVTSDIDVALASGRGGLPINRVVAAFFRARCRCDLLRQHIIAVEIIAYESFTDGCDALIRRSNELLAMRRNLMDSGSSAAPDKILAGSDARSDAGLPVVCDHGEIIAANDVAVMYDLMLHDGDAKRIDDAMQRLDDAMIDIIINHYIERLSGSSIGAEAEDGDSMMDDLPAGFRLESLKMDFLNRYEDALTGDDPSAWQSSRGLQ